jgi:hypothetical protein
LIAVCNAFFPRIFNLAYNSWYFLHSCNRLTCFAIPLGELIEKLKNEGANKKLFFHLPSFRAWKFSLQDRLADICADNGNTNKL